MLDKCSLEQMGHTEVTKGLAKSGSEIQIPERDEKIYLRTQ